MNYKELISGIKAGMPVCVGYFSVSFGFGAMVIAQGLSVLQGALISATNLTSAGQFAGLTVIAAGGTILEMILTQLVINSRYALMSLALGQKLGPDVGTGKRLIAAFFNTDELFAIYMAGYRSLNLSYIVGSGIVAAIGWTSGTILGAVAGSILPMSLRVAIGVMLYGMFIAVVIPQAKKEKTILYCMIIALIFSCMFKWIPVLNSTSAGLTIVICTIATAALCAILFPIDEEVSE